MFSEFLPSHLYSGVRTKLNSLLLYIGGIKTKLFMRLKVDNYELKVIHWDYEGQPLNNLKEPIPLLDVEPVHSKVTNKKGGIRFRWTYRLEKLSGGVVLSYIAEHLL